MTSEKDVGIVSVNELLAILTADAVKIKAAVANGEGEVRLSPTSVKYITRVSESLGKPPKGLLVAYMSGKKGSKLVEKTHMLLDGWIEAKGFSINTHSRLAASKTLLHYTSSIVGKRGTKH